MKQKKKGLYLLGPLLACGFLISSCGNSNSDSGQPVPGNSDTVEPAPTEPPVITTTTDWSAAMGTITLDVLISNFTPTRVRLYPKGINDDWVETDNSTPFSFVVDISEFAPGDYEMLVIADNETSEVEKNEVVFISGCNGQQSLCDRSYDQVRYVTAHNAMSSSTDNWAEPNQNLDVPAQLQAGVRGIMLLKQTSLRQRQRIFPVPSIAAHRLTTCLYSITS